MASREWHHQEDAFSPIASKGAQPADPVLAHRDPLQTSDPETRLRTGHRQWGTWGVQGVEALDPGSPRDVCGESGNDLQDSGGWHSHGGTRREAAARPEDRWHLQSVMIPLEGGPAECPHISSGLLGATRSVCLIQCSAFPLYLHLGEFEAKEENYNSVHKTLPLQCKGALADEDTCGGGSGCQPPVAGRTDPSLCRVTAQSHMQKGPSNGKAGRQGA